MSVYCLPAGYQRQRPSGYDDWAADGGRVWQPDVYPFAADLARARGVERIIDVGCGSGKKLVDLAGDFDVIGIDTAATVERCRERWGTGTWIAHDLDGEWALPPRLPRDAVVVCSDVIEHLWMPERVVGALLVGGWPVVLSTPDRAMTHGQGQMGPPPNAAHAQEWTLSELVAWLKVFGANVVDARLTRSHDGTADEQTCLVTVEGFA